MVHLGMVLLKYLPCSLVDPLIIMLGNLKYGDLSKYGICRLSKGPFSHKETSGRSLVIDIGTLGKIRAGEIQVLPALEMIEGGNVVFDNGATHQFDAIVFATGYKSVAKKWLKDDGKLLNEEGMPKSKYPNHWKGKNGLYYAGLGRRNMSFTKMLEELTVIKRESEDGRGSKLKQIESFTSPSTTQTKDH